MAVTLTEITTPSLPSDVAGSYQVQLKLTRTADSVGENYSAQYLKVECLTATGSGLDTDIFIYSRRPPQAGDSFNSFFEAVACPNDLAEVVRGEPQDSDTTTTLFRTDTVEVYCRSREEMDQLWQLILSDVRELLRALDLRTSYQADPVTYTLTEVANTSVPVAPSPNYTAISSELTTALGEELASVTGGSLTPDQQTFVNTAVAAIVAQAALCDGSLTTNLNNFRSKIAGLCRDFDLLEESTTLQFIASAMVRSTVPRMSL